MSESKNLEMELFKTGTQTDSKGRSKVWTVSDIDKMVENFKESEQVPACIGHAQTNEPAMGWFSSFERKGNSLWGTLGSRVDEFGVMLKNKMFKNRSISLTPDLHLRHVAFLGVERPAIKDLEDYAFSTADDLITIDFEETNFNSFTDNFAFRSIARVLRNMREALIEKDGVEKANTLIAEHLLDDIEDAGRQKLEATPEVTSHFSETPTTETPKMDELELAKLKITELEASNVSFSEEITAHKTEIEGLKAEVVTEKKAFSDFKESELKVNFSEYLDGIIKDGRMLPANKDANLSILMSLNGQADLDFSESDESAKTSPVNVFKKTLELAPKALEFSEIATGEDAPIKEAGSKLSVLSEARATEKNISFSEASKEIIRENPTLVTAIEIQNKI